MQDQKDTVFEDQKNQQQQTKKKTQKTKTQNQNYTIRTNDCQK